MHILSERMPLAEMNFGATSTKILTATIPAKDSVITKDY